MSCESKNLKRNPFEAGYEPRVVNVEPFSDGGKRDRAKLAMTEYLKDFPAVESRITVLYGYPGCGKSYFAKFYSKAAIQKLELVYISARDDLQVSNNLAAVYSIILKSLDDLAEKGYSVPPGYDDIKIRYLTLEKIIPAIFERYLNKVFDHLREQGLRGLIIFLDELELLIADKKLEEVRELLKLFGFVEHFDLGFVLATNPREHEILKTSWAGLERRERHLFRECELPGVELEGVSNFIRTQLDQERIRKMPQKEALKPFSEQAVQTIYEMVTKTAPSKPENSLYGAVSLLCCKCLDAVLGRIPELAHLNCSDITPDVVIEVAGYYSIYAKLTDKLAFPEALLTTFVICNSKQAMFTYDNFRRFYNQTASKNMLLKNKPFQERLVENIAENLKAAGLDITHEKGKYIELHGFKAEDVGPAREETIPDEDIKTMEVLLARAEKPITESEILSSFIGAVRYKWEKKSFAYRDGVLTYDSSSGKKCRILLKVFDELNEQNVRTIGKVDLCLFFVPQGKIAPALEAFPVDSVQRVLVSPPAFVAEIDYSQFEMPAETFVKKIGWKEKKLPVWKVMKALQVGGAVPKKITDRFEYFYEDFRSILFSKSFPLFLEAQMKSLEDEKRVFPLSFGKHTLAEVVAELKFLQRNFAGKTFSREEARKKCPELTEDLLDLLCLRGFILSERGRLKLCFDKIQRMADELYSTFGSDKKIDQNRFTAKYGKDAIVWMDILVDLKYLALFKGSYYCLSKTKSDIAQREKLKASLMKRAERLASIDQSLLQLARNLPSISDPAFAGAGDELKEKLEEKNKLMRQEIVSKRSFIFSLLSSSEQLDELARLVPAIQPAVEEIESFSKNELMLKSIKSIEKASEEDLLKCFEFIAQIQKSWTAAIDALFKLVNDLKDAWEAIQRHRSVLHPNEDAQVLRIQNTFQNNPWLRQTPTADLTPKDLVNLLGDCQRLAKIFEDYLETETNRLSLLLADLADIPGVSNLNVEVQNLRKPFPVSILEKLRDLNVRLAAAKDILSRIPVLSEIGVSSDAKKVLDILKSNPGRHFDRKSLKRVENLAGVDVDACLSELCRKKLLDEFYQYRWSQ